MPGNGFPAHSLDNQGFMHSMQPALHRSRLLRKGRKPWRGWPRRTVNERPRQGSTRRGADWNGLCIGAQGMRREAGGDPCGHGWIGNAQRPRSAAGAALPPTYNRTTEPRSTAVSPSAVGRDRTHSRTVSSHPPRCHRACGFHRTRRPPEWTFTLVSFLTTLARIPTPSHA
jgi:hypothetical protein